MFLDEIEIPGKDLKLLENANILITYTTHPRSHTGTGRQTL